MPEYTWNTIKTSPIERLITSMAEWLANGDARPKLMWHGWTIWTDHPGIELLGDELSLLDFENALYSHLALMEESHPDIASELLEALEDSTEAEIHALRRAVALRMAMDREIAELRLESGNPALVALV